MNITTSSDAERVTLRVVGRFDAHETAAFREVVVPVADREGGVIALDLSDVNFVDSTALAELVRWMKHCRERGGDLVIEHPSKPVSVILELTGLDRAFVVVR